MTEEEIYKLIPKRFRIANHTIKVEIVPYIIHSNGDMAYGQWNETKLTIRVAQGMKFNDEVVTFKKEQILNTFYHELFHCFRFFINLSLDDTIEEMFVQGFANCFREYETSKR